MQQMIFMYKICIFVKLVDIIAFRHLITIRKRQKYHPSIEKVLLARILPYTCKSDHYFNENS